MQHLKTRIEFLLNVFHTRFTQPVWLKKQTMFILPCDWHRGGLMLTTFCAKKFTHPFAKQSKRFSRLELEPLQNFSIFNGKLPTALEGWLWSQKGYFEELYSDSYTIWTEIIGKHSKLEIISLLKVILPLSIPSFVHFWSHHFSWTFLQVQHGNRNALKLWIIWLSVFRVSSFIVCI